MNKHQLASTIWESANQMQSKIEANEYKDFILGFIFYKYLSERELELFHKEKLSEEEIKKVDENDVKNVRDALSDFDQNIDEVYMYWSTFLVTLCSKIINYILLQWVSNNYYRNVV